LSTYIATGKVKQKHTMVVVDVAHDVVGVARSVEEADELARKNSNRSDTGRAYPFGSHHNI
jgi:predicted RNA-binding protein with PUA domain